MEELSEQEIALLLATRVSENCQSIPELAMNVSQPADDILMPLISLIAKGILVFVDCYNGPAIGYNQETEIAQQIYAEIHGEKQ